MNKRILIVDDDYDILRLLEKGLALEQFQTITVCTGKEALQALASISVDFIILDIMMPEMDGLETCRIIRANYDIPILFLTARDREIDKVLGLELGADDYMTKPFSMAELTSRIKSHFRKEERMLKAFEGQQKIKVVDNESPLILNEETYEAFLYEEKLDLSTKEFQILLYFSEHLGQVLSREQIYDYVWGDSFGDMNTVTVHIKNIRKKLGNYNPIKTIWGVGYKYVMGGNEV